jgi:hypothetical protein
VGWNRCGNAGKDGGKNGDAESKEKKGKQHNSEVLGQLMF